MWKINVLRELSKGESSIQYKTKTGSMKTMDVSQAAVDHWGVIPFQSVVTPKGEATVIGVADGHLWFHCKCDSGASYWNSYKTKEDLKQNEVLPQRRNSVESKAKVFAFEGSDYVKIDPESHSKKVEFPITTLVGTQQSVSCLVFDKEILYMCFRGDNVITGWDTSAYKLKVAYKHKAEVVAFCIAEFALYSTSADWKLNVFDKESGTHIQSIIPHNGPIQSFCLGNFKGVEIMMTGSRDHKVLTLDVPGFTQKNIFPGLESDVTAVLPVHDTFHVMDLDLVYTATRGGSLRAFDADDKESVWTNYIANANASINALCRYRERLYSADSDSCIRVYDRLGGKLLDKIDFPAPVNALLVDDDQGKLYAGLGNGNTVVIDCSTTMIRCTFEGNTAPVTALAANKNGLIFAGSQDGAIRIFREGATPTSETIDISTDLESAHAYTRAELITKIDKLLDIFQKYKQQ